jgi:hypothetical protein
MFLGKPASEVPENYERGDLLIDPAIDLETSATKAFLREARESAKCA